MQLISMAAQFIAVPLKLTVSPALPCSVDSTSPAGQKLSAMLRNITEAYKETLTLLQLEAFHAVGLFTFKGHKAIALHITETLLDNGVLVPSVEQVGLGDGVRAGVVDTLSRSCVCIEVSRGLVQCTVVMTILPSILPSQVEQILKLLAPLMCDQPDQPEEVVCLTCTHVFHCTVCTYVCALVAHH